jgi:uncharacterized membrane protein YedE/YeeE
MNHFTPVASLLGGLLIGLAATIVLAVHGKVAGISGIFGGLLQRATVDRPFRFAFLGGLLAGGVLLRIFLPSSLPSADATSLPLWVILGAGLLVGFGTRLGSGCTSGHGVCGLSRFSGRSLVATLTFMFTGGVTVFLAHRLGVGP